MFKTLTLYWTSRIEATAGLLDALLATSTFTPCAPTQPEAVGWVPPRGYEFGPLAESVDGEIILMLKAQKRLLPSHVVAKRTDELAEIIEEQTGRKPGKKARKDLKEQATHELLPHAFTRDSLTPVWISPEKKLLVVGATGAKADAIVTLLIQSIEGLSVSLVQTAEAPANVMAAWLMDGVTPEGFSIGREAELKGTDELKSVVKYGRHPLDIDEVRAHLVSGKRPTRISLDFRERVAFTLTEGLSLKGIQFLDLAFEGRGEHEDAFAAANGHEVREHPGLHSNGYQVRHQGHWMGLLWNKNFKRYTADRRLSLLVQSFAASKSTGAQA